MMRTAFIVTNILLATAFASAQTTSTKKCLETSYAFYRNGVAESKISRTFDNNGNLLTETEVVQSKYRGYYTEKKVYEYDTKGNNTKITELKDGQTKKVIEKTFDATGQSFKETLGGNTAQNQPFTTTSLNIKTGESEQIFFEADGKESVREKKKVDANGNLLQREVIGKNGKTSMLDEKTYDANGNILKYTNNDAVAKVIHTTDYVYSTDGRLLSDKTTRNDVVFAETKYEYNMYKQLVKKIRLNGQGKEDYYHTYEYNNAGGVMKESYFYNNKLVSYQTYEYDDRGNKTKESFFDTNGNLTSLKEWTFECK